MKRRQPRQDTPETQATLSTIHRTKTDKTNNTTQKVWAQPTPPNTTVDENKYLRRVNSSYF